jgi:hypothetical protein
MTVNARKAGLPPALDGTLEAIEIGAMLSTWLFGRMTRSIFPSWSAGFCTSLLDRIESTYSMASCAEIILLHRMTEVEHSTPFTFDMMAAIAP